MKSFLSLRTMRRILAGCLFLALGIGACKVYDQLLTFSIARGLPTIYLFTDLVKKDSTKELYPPSDITRFETDFRSNGTSTQNIISAKLTKLIMYIDTSESKVHNFNFLKDVKIRFGAKGLADTLIAWADTVATGSVRKFDFVTTTMDVTQYVKQDSMQFKVTMTFRDTISEQAKIHCSYILEINAQPE